jgi:hypothetical protein
VQTDTVPEPDPNPFRIAGELLPHEMIDRGEEVARLFSLGVGGHASRIVAPRRYGKTSLLRRVLAEASAEGWATALVDLEGVLSLSSVVVRIERAYDRELKGAIRRTVDGFSEPGRSASRCGRFRRPSRICARRRERAAQATPSSTSGRVRGA